MLRAPTQRELTALASLSDVGNFKALAQLVYDSVNHACANETYRPYVVFGARKAKTQLELYAHGREMTSSVPLPYGEWKQTGRVITRALPHQSAHCYAVAMDLALINDADGAWLHDEHPAWGTVIGQTYRRFGLESGHYWHFKDSAHGELPGWQGLVKQGTLQLIV